jgi:hypothetical protein
MAGFEHWASALSLIQATLMEVTLFSITSGRVTGDSRCLSVRWRQSLAYSEICLSLLACCMADSAAYA